MSAKRIKTKADTRLTYDPLTKRVHTPNGSLPADDYERIRTLRPELKFPSIYSLPCTK